MARRRYDFNLENHTSQRRFTLRLKLPAFGGIKIPQNLKDKLGVSFLQRRPRVRAGLLITVVVLVLAEIATLLSPLFTHRSYALGPAGSLLLPISQAIAKKLTYDQQKRAFVFNAEQDNQSNSANSQQVSAIAYQDPSKGIQVTDPLNKVEFSLQPKFSLATGQQDGDRVVYPLNNGAGWAVYTMQGAGVKEDIVLTKSDTNQQTFNFKLNINQGLEARLENDGSIGIYGNSLLSGNVTAGTEKDAELLQKARQNAPKNTLVFRIPKPTIVEAGKKKSRVSAAYSLKGNDLSVTATGLSQAHYPLTIDPSIYVATAEQFMSGNNETNINFNVSNKLIEKGQTTGARFDTWNSTTSLPSPSWGGGTAAAGGYIYTVGGTSLNGQVYTSQGAATFVVPTGITSITVKLWGGGGGGGAGGSSAAGGAGGGSGFVEGTVTVTPGETLNVYVGGGGGGGTRNTAGGGGGGGGYSSIYRGSTLLALAAGGGGGGGGRNSSGNTGGQGGPGGGASGVNGSAAGVAGGGGGGTASAGGSGGTGGSNSGTAGASLTGGAGANGRTSQGADGGANNGGLATGGSGGSVTSTTRAAGGGGGAGYFGGGGGSGSSSGSGGAGGGGGSGYTGSMSGVTNQAGSGQTPGNSTDTYRNGAGAGGGAGATNVDGSTGADGVIAVIYGSGGTAVSQTVSWSKINTTDGTIESANPGSGACNGWCSTSAYNLPSARANFSLVAYNGFLYAIGGTDSTGTRQSSVYIAKLGANGEPRLWHPTSDDETTWVYWYQDSNLSSIRAYSAAVAYNNRMYLLGGIGASAPVNTTEIASINPTGTLGSWSSSASLPYNLYGHSAQVYNDRLYILGGASSVGGTPLSSVYYIKINSDGSLNSWKLTSGFSNGRMTVGGNFSVVWGAYLYISGGCRTADTNGYCTNIQSDTQVASINADGSLDVWNTVGGVSASRIGFGMVAWRDRVYAIGGCSSQSPTDGSCSTMLGTIIYGDINQDGDASTVGTSVNATTSPCSDTTPTGCDLPGTTYIGNMLSAAVITNGYLYVIGGCTNVTCSAVTGNTAYVAISSTGTMTKPATCPSGTYRGNAWCVDSTNTVSGGISATSAVVFGGRIYLVGGRTGSGAKDVIARTTTNSDGSIGAWTTQTQTGVGATSVSYNYAYARANPASTTNPGNLYIFGGCTGGTNAGCTNYTQGVYKCNIATDGSINGCTTTGQLQIGIIPGDSQAGLGIMSGTVYANYIYLIGGVSPNLTDLDTVRYAKFDNNNNVVTAGSSGWTESPNTMLVGRRRAAAFGYNGYIYVVGGYDGTGGGGVLADIEFIKVNVSDGSLGSATETFQASAVTINQRWGLTVPISNSYAYVIGGCTDGLSPNCNVATDTIQTFQVYNNDSGSPAGYSTSANTYSTNANRIGASSTILNGYIYVAGGCTSATDCTAATSDVSYAALDYNGDIGTWSSTTGALPAARTWGKLEAAGGTLYYIGGQSNTATDYRSEVYYATPSSGNVSSWSTASNGLPAGRTKFGSAIWNDRLYVVGGAGSGTGCTASSVCNTVYVSPQLSSGGNITSAWSSSSTSFNVARSGLTAIAYANNLYVFGGHDGTNYLSDGQYSQISTSTGSAGSWTYTTSMPGPLSQSEGFAANGYIYLFGGRSADTTCNPKTLVAPISANTTISTGNNPTGTGEWYETNQRFTGSRYGAAATYYDGKAYVLGGACGSTLTYASPVTQQTSLLSQPQVAKYSIMIDNDSDVYPSQWLLNGLDNSIGARWQLKYRSMTNPLITDSTKACVWPAMTTWGQETNFGNVTLGTPGVYTPKDGSGNNTNCARYFYFSVTVDSSQAFGYPDDVTRGPTITDLTLQFTADPNKRLMHGRTFTGGLQQPDDTPAYSN